MQTLISISFLIILVLVVIFVLRELLSFRGPSLDNHYEEQNKRWLLQSKIESEKYKTRHSKNKKDWTIEDWNDEYKNEDNHHIKKIYWKEQLILQRDNFQCRFCEATDRNLLHAYYDSLYGLQNIRIRGASDVISLFYTICDNCIFDKITPKNFERLVGKIFERMGYSVQITGSTGDEGIDLICTRRGEYEKIIVQCKRYKGKVGAPTIRDFYGALLHSKASKGYIVTTGHFTSNASNWAKGKPIELINRENLIRLLK